MNIWINVEESFKFCHLVEDNQMAFGLKSLYRCMMKPLNTLVISVVACSVVDKEYYVLTLCFVGRKDFVNKGFTWLLWFHLLFLSTVNYVLVIFVLIISSITMRIIMTCYNYFCILYSSINYFYIVKKIMSLK